LGVSLRDKIRNEELRRITKVTDAIERITHLKWNWAGHVARMSDIRWTKRIIEWRLRDEAHRNRGLEEDIFKLNPRCPRPSKMVYVKRGLCPAVDETSSYMI